MVEGEGSRVWSVGCLSRQLIFVPLPSRVLFLLQSVCLSFALVLSIPWYCLLVCSFLSATHPQCLNWPLSLI